MKKKEKKSKLKPTETSITENAENAENAEVIDEKTKSSAKDRFLILLLSVVALALLVVGVDAYTGDSLQADETTTVVSTWADSQEVVQTTVTTTAADTTTTQPTTKKAENTTTKKAEETTTEKPAETTVPSAEDETEEILAAITDGINSLKASDASFTGVKTQNISVQLTTCSVPALTGLVNKVIELFTGEETYTYDFTNGTATDPEENEPISSNKAIPPTDKPFTLTKEGVASAKKEQEGENTVYTIVVVAEKSTLADPRPPHHNAAGDTFDLSDISIPTGEITKADFEYPGATVSITTDKNGKVIKYHERLEIKGIGEGNAIGITASGEMEGYIDETWDITWK